MICVLLHFPDFGTWKDTLHIDMKEPKILNVTIKAANLYINRNQASRNTKESFMKIKSHTGVR